MVRIVILYSVWTLVWMKWREVHLRVQLIFILSRLFKTFKNNMETLNVSIWLSTSKNTATKKVEAFVVAYEVSLRLNGFLPLNYSKTTGMVSPDIHLAPKLFLTFITIIIVFTFPIKCVNSSGSDCYVLNNLSTVLTISSCWKGVWGWW